MKKLIGHVSSDEKDAIENLFERKKALSELAGIIPASNDELYEKLVKDVMNTGKSFQNWWDTMAGKYKWESTPDGHWEIDFNDCSIYLVTPE